MKIRIFALAKELNVDSKELIKQCNDAGIPVKSSALASISPEEKDQLMAYLDSQKSGSTPAPPETKQSKLAPEPPTPAPEKKVRAIRSMTPRPMNASEKRNTPEPEQEEVAETPSTQEPVAEQEQNTSTEAPAETAETEAPAAEKEAPQEPTPASEPAAEQQESEEKSQAEPEAKSAADDATEEPRQSETPADEQTEDKPVEAAAETAEKPAAKSTTKTPPLMDDPHGGGGGSSKIREMTPRASLATRKAKPRPKPSLPSLAAPPTFKKDAPKPKKGDSPAQKPDVRLTKDVLDGQIPLAAHMKKHAEQKDRADKSEKTDRKPPRRLSSVAEQRDQRKTSRSKRGGRFDDDRSGYRSRPTRRTKRKNRNIEYKSSAVVEQPITVRSLSEAMGRPAKDIITVLFKQGTMAQINDALDEEMAMEIALDFEVDLEIKRAADMEDSLSHRIDAEIPEDQLQPRPPIVTILGHVDHGKTTLVDTLRSSHVADGEAGGITQHIAAYQVEKNNQLITFVDTPGHAAFGEMRARGANVTDIIVLVVAANDGVMPQTKECIAHAKAAGVPLIVALNKIDLPDINEQKILQELAAEEVLVAEWGGDVEMVRTSGLNNIGIDDLLETILLTAELQEYKASPTIEPYGVCLEAFQDEGRGPLAWMIVQQGTLKVGDVVLCGTAFGRIRAMFDDADNEVSEASPSKPIKLAGLNTVPAAGSHFFIMEDIESARELTEQRIHEGRTESLASRGGPKTLEEILGGGGGTKELPLIVKADTPGSIEALKGEINKFDHPEVKVEILHSAVGGVNESDVSLASASGAIIIAFHVVAEDRAELLAMKENIEIRRYDIIYEVTHDIKLALEGLLDPDAIEVSTGRAIVLQTFSITRFGTIAGCRVLNGSIDRNSRVHVIRDQTIINDYSIGSLRREKEDVKLVREGMECGIRLDGFNDVKEGDLLEAFKIEEKQRTLED